jgi:hypothetical protein
MEQDELDVEASKIAELLIDKKVSKVFRPRTGEVCLEFSDGTRFFVDSKQNGELEFSITAGIDD